MSIAISGTLVMVVFLVVALLMFGTFLDTTSTQGASLNEASDLRASQVTGTVSITSTVAVDSGDGTNVTMTADNTGAISYGDFSQVDLLAKYTNSTGDQEVRRLNVVCKQLCGDATDPDDNQWAITIISPDGYNPKMWDPDETINVSIRLAPPVKSGDSGTLVLVVPGGVKDSAYFTN